MNNYENIVKKLIRKIQRAAEKKNWIKHDKLKVQLNEVLNFQEMANQKKKLEDHMQDKLHYVKQYKKSICECESECDHVYELVSLQNNELSMQLEKINNLNNNVNQLKLEAASVQQVMDTAFDFENKHDKSGKSESEPPQLVSVQAGQVGNQIGGSFWEQQDPLISKQLRNTVQSDHSYNPYNVEGVIDDGEEREDISYEELEAMREEEDAQESSDDEDRD